MFNTMAALLTVMESRWGGSDTRCHAQTPGAGATGPLALADGASALYSPVRCRHPSLAPGSAALARTGHPCCISISTKSTLGTFSVGRRAGISIFGCLNPRTTVPLESRRGLHSATSRSSATFPLIML